MNCRTLTFAISLILLAGWSTAELPPDISGTRPTVDGEVTEILISTFLIDISRVDGADQSFTADLFVLLRWHDPRLEGVFEATDRVPLDEIWNPRLQILNGRTLETTFHDQAEVAPDGTVIFRQRYFGAFSAPMDLHDLPFDRQRFHIQLVVPGYGPGEVALVTAPDGTVGDKRRDPFTVADWDIGDVEAYPEPYRVTAAGHEISGYMVAVDGRRLLGFWAGKAFVSVAIIVAMSWLVFWIDPKFVAPRLSVTVTSMLTLIAYRFLLDGSMPELSYLTRMDSFLIGSTLLVLVTIVQVVITTHATERDQGRRAQQLNRFSRWLFPAMFVGLTAASLWAG